MVLRQCDLWQGWNTSWCLLAWFKHIYFVIFTLKKSQKGEEVSSLFRKKSNEPSALFFYFFFLLSGHYLLFSTIAKDKGTGAAWKRKIKDREKEEQGEKQKRKVDLSRGS